MLVKKLVLVGLVLSLGASSAFANHNASLKANHRFYVGGDIQSNKLNLDNVLDRVTMNGSSSFLKTSLPGLSVFGGYKWDRLGAELGVTHLQRVTYTGTARSGSTLVLNASLKQLNYNTYLDGIYYHPLTSNLDLRALVGVGILSTTFKGNLTINDNGNLIVGSAKHTESKAGIRLGVGAEYYFTRHFSSNLMFKFQTGNDYFKNMQTLGLAFAYHF